MQTLPDAFLFFFPRRRARTDRDALIDWQGDEARELVRQALVPGARKGLQSFVAHHSDLLVLRSPAGGGRALVVAAKR